MLRLLNSSSEMLKEIVGMLFGVTPAARAARRKATLLSPLMVFRMASGRAATILPNEFNDVRTPEHEVFFADDLGPEAFGLVADNGIRGPREDVIGTHQEEPLLFQR